MIDKYASAPTNMKAPEFRVWIDDNAIVHAVCKSCEKSGATARGVGRYEDRAERFLPGMNMLRLCMAEHAAVYHTHR